MGVINEISQQTGLSASSVAQILQGRIGYSETSRQRVLEAARRLNYRPNYLSKALKGGSSRSIGSIWTLRGLTGDVEIAGAVLEEAQNRGYATYHAEYCPDLPRLRQSIEILAERRVDLLLLRCDSAQLGELRKDLRAFKGVVAVCPEPVDEFEGDLLVYDRYRAIEQVADYLGEQGRRRPALVLHPASTELGKAERFLQACRARGMEGASLIPLEAFVSHRKVIQAYEQTYAMRFAEGVDVDALLCGTDEGAMTAIRFFESRRLDGARVPEDVAVIGWNNIQASQVFDPRLASVDRSIDEMIGVLGQMLLERLESPQLAPRRQIVHMQFIWRESAGGVAPKDSRAIKETSHLNSFLRR